jgi:transcriptional regulator with XRE-family HTH domain
MINLSERVKELRMYTGLSQEKFAEKIGLSRSTLALIETNKSVPGYEALNKMCTEFKVLPAYFFDNDNVDLKTYVAAAKYSEKKGEGLTLNITELAKLGKDYEVQLENELARKNKNTLEFYKILKGVESLSEKLYNFLPQIALDDIGDITKYPKWKDGLPSNHPLIIGYENFKANRLEYLTSREANQKDIVEFYKRLKDFLLKMKPLDKDNEINLM